MVVVIIPATPPPFDMTRLSVHYPQRNRVTWQNRVVNMQCCRSTVSALI